MKEWLTAQEIADQALPGMPGTKRGVNLIAERSSWPDSMAYARARAGREGGGGVEYNIALLPTLARIEYERRHRKVLQLAPSSAEPEQQTAAPVMTDRARGERDARLAIIKAFDGFRRGQQLTMKSLTQIFVARYNAKHFKVEDWIRERFPRISTRSLTRWRSKEPDALGYDPSKSRLGTGLFDTGFEGRLKAFTLGAIATQPHISADDLRDQIRYEFGDFIQDAKGALKPLPGIRTLQDYVARLKVREAVVLAQWTNPDHYRSHMHPSGVGSHRWILRPNQLWMIDASPIDALCVDGRYTIYACIDVATRRTILYVSRTPRAAAVAMLMRIAIMAWGAPDAVKTDNGSDFVARDTKRLLDYLEIEQILSDPYTPQQKAHVERVIKTFQHKCAVLMPGYVGHSVADRRAIEERKSFADRLGQSDDKTFGVELTGPRLQALVNDWIEAKYQHRPHAGLRKSKLGRTPFLAGLGAGFSPRMVDVRALDVLLMPVAEGGGVRTVTKTGIRIEHYHYLCRQTLPGEKVFVRMDPVDAGRAYAFSIDDGRFIGEALCAELAGLDPAELVRAQKAAQSQLLADRGREAKAEARKIKKGPNLLERQIEVARRDAPAVIPFPVRETAHETPAIRAALDVTRPAEVVALDPRQAAEHARLQAEAFPALVALSEATDARQASLETRAHVVSANVAALPVSEKERFRRAKQVQAAIEAGDAVDTRDAVWFGSYRETPEFRGHQAMLEEYGESYLAF